MPESDPIPAPEKLPRGTRHAPGAAPLDHYPAEAYTVHSWGEGGPGTRSTEVLLGLHATGAGIPHQVLARFPTPEEVDRLIAALRRHRYDVWPGEG